MQILLNREGVAFDIQAQGEPYLHPGRSAVISGSKGQIATVGEVHPATAESFGMTEKAYIAEIDLEALYACAQPMDKVEDLPRMPAVSRDIALVLPEAQELLPVLNAVRRAGGVMLEDVQLFDVYRGAQLGEGKKSAAFSLTFRSTDHTLLEAEIAALMDKVQRSCKVQFAAEIRE